MPNGFFAFPLKNWMLGGPSWAGRSPDLQDTKCLPGGFCLYPLQGVCLWMFFP